MKTNFFFALSTKALLLVMTFTLALSQNLNAQDNPGTVYATIACFKDKNNDFKAFNKEFGKPFHQELIRQGKLLDWLYFEVAFPNGTDCDCDYRDIRVFTDIKQLEYLLSGEEMMKVAKKIFPDQDLGELMNRFMSAVEFKGDQVFQIIDGLVQGPSPTELVSVNFMTVPQGKENAYLEMETGVWKPIHKARKEAGKIVDWSILRRILPYGSDYDGDFITVDNWGNFENMAKPDPAGLWKKVHPNKDQAATYEKMTQLRNLKRSELWQFVDGAKVDDSPATSTKKR